MKNRLENNDRPKLFQKFSMDSARNYLICTIVMFHIVPLAVLFMPMGGADILSQSFMMLLNPVYLGISGFLYGMKIGFNFRYNIITAILGGLSVMMYYQFEDWSYMVVSGIVMFIVYFIIDVLGTLCGGYLRKYI